MVNSHRHQQMVSVEMVHCQILDLQKDYFDTEEIYILANIFEVTAISKEYAKKPIIINMTFGETLVQKKLFDGTEAHAINSTSEIYPAKINKNYSYLNLADEKPCLWIIREVPYFKKRIYNSNILMKISQGLRAQLKEIENLFENGNPKDTFPVISQKLLDVVDYILTVGKRYIDIVSSYRVTYNTKLDNEKRKYCLQEMSNIIKKAKLLGKKYSNKKTFWKLQKMCMRIEILIDDVQDCWPDIILWLSHGNKHVAFVKIPARDLIFSNIEEERGQYCGVKRTICFYDNAPDKRHLAAKMEIKMFLILERQKASCQMEMPPELNCDSIETVPRCLVTKAKKLFELRCYIFQGKIVAGFDKSGLGDPLLRLLVQNQLKETRVIPKCLNPIWDQTLVFSNVIIDEFYIPSLLLEIYDKEEVHANEFVGRAILHPKLHSVDIKRESIKLEWYKAYNNEEVSGEVLGAFEYTEVTEDSQSSKQLILPKCGKIFTVPSEIKPKLVAHKMEVLFWGMRNLGKVNLVGIKRPRITVYCGDNFLESDTIENAHKFSNFAEPTKSLSLTFPIQREYAPPLRFKMYDSRRFGIYAYAGVHITQIYPFLITPMTEKERINKMSEISIASEETCQSSIVSITKVETLHINIQSDSDTEDAVEERRKRGGILYRVCYLCCKPLDRRAGRVRLPISSTNTYEQLAITDDENDIEDFDWWTKFYASIEVTSSGDLHSMKKIKTLRMYDSELESQPEFKGFTDMLTSFEIFKGRRTGDSIIDEVHVTGIFKGSIKIYEWPLLDPHHKYVTHDGYPLEDGVFQNVPENTPVRYVLRVYVVRANGVRPKDLNGLSDPYLILKLNDQVVNDKENYVPKNVNPIFGRCFEFNGTFPQDYLLKIYLMDYDVASIDDLIGKTEIDLENRFYSKHMACCGIAETYEESGYCAWRGQHRPSALLADLCKKFNIGGPEYKPDSVKVGSKEFFSNDFAPSGDHNKDIEVLALAALRRWKEVPVVGFSLVPEHVETRSLYHPTKPGIEQGKLQLWIDIFPITDLPPPPQVDITVRKPVSYELRVIIWNTDEVKLDEDDFYSGERKSDIYVKGWVLDSSQAQLTDVHYRSLTGEGNFNWRFVFHFDYLATENKTVVKKKDNVFAFDQTEYKMPCKLTLQVWDNDTFSKDDFIGTLSLELSKLHRPAKTLNKCTLKILEKGAPSVNLFKIRRTKGWWPLRGRDSKHQGDIVTGKVEAELELLLLEEAQKEPAGIGRHEPQALPLPNRPDTSFSWFKNPWKALKFVVCKIYKWKVIVFLLIVIGVCMAISFFYALPTNIFKAAFGIK